MSATPGTTVTPVLVAELAVEGETMPVYAHLVDHRGVRVLVDTGLKELHPLVADMAPRLLPWHGPAGLDLATVDLVVNTHLHVDHCGGNHLFPGVPVHVQQRELDDARGPDSHTIREWVDFPGARYEPADGEVELLPGLRLLPAPRHTPGSQVVVVEDADGVTVVCGDTAVWHGQLDEPEDEGQRLVRSLQPHTVWLAHTHEPWRPVAPSS
jgi:N-acyl homoserine lactone hydrolase